MDAEQEARELDKANKIANELLAKMDAAEGKGFNFQQLDAADKKYVLLGEDIDYDFHAYMGLHPSLEIPERELKRVYHQIICMGGTPFLDIPSGTGGELLSRIRKLITRNFKYDMLRANKRFKWWQAQQYRNTNVFAKKRIDRPRPK